MERGMAGREREGGRERERERKRRIVDVDEGIEKWMREG